MPSNNTRNIQSAWYLHFALYHLVITLPFHAPATCILPKTPTFSYHRLTLAGCITLIFFGMASGETTPCITAILCNSCTAECEIFTLTQAFPVSSSTLSDSTKMWGVQVGLRRWNPTIYPLGAWVHGGLRKLNPTCEVMWQSRNRQWCQVTYFFCITITPSCGRDSIFCSCNLQRSR